MHKLTDEEAQLHTDRIDRAGPKIADLFKNEGLDASDAIYLTLRYAAALMQVVGMSCADAQQVAVLAINQLYEEANNKEDAS